MKTKITLEFDGDEREDLDIFYKRTENYITIHNIREALFSRMKSDDVSASEELFIEDLFRIINNEE